MSEIAVSLQAVEFIEMNLAEDISVGDMAEAVSFSLYHFSRVFSRTTRFSPYDYLIRRRLCEAAHCLMASSEKVIDVAEAYRFNAPETFSRAFRRMFGLQPRQVKLGHRVDCRQLLSRPTRAYLEFLDAGTPTPVAGQMSDLRVVGVTVQTNIHSPDDERLRLWDLLESEINHSALAGKKRHRYGIRLFSRARSSEQFMYLAGTSLGPGEVAPETLLEKHIPATDYASFELPHCANSAALTRAYVYQSWWPRATLLPPRMIEVERWPDRSGKQPGSVVRSAPQSICFPLPAEIAARPSAAG